MTEMFKGEPDAGHDAPTPPYEGRKESADVAPVEAGEQDGAGVGGARRPTEADPGLRQDDPEQSPGGAVASPGDEQPAAEHDGDAPGEASTGPAHQPGVPRGENLT